MLQLALARPRAVLAGWATMVRRRSCWARSSPVRDAAAGADLVADAVARFVGTSGDRAGR